MNGHGCKKIYLNVKVFMAIIENNYHIFLKLQRQKSICFSYLKCICTPFPSNNVEKGSFRNRENITTLKTTDSVPCVTEWATTLSL